MIAVRAAPLPIKLVADTFPETVNTLEEVLNEKALLAPALPALLKITSPFEPGTTMLPEMLPCTLPMK